MAKKSILVSIKQLNRPVFTTAELAAISGSSLSATVQVLNTLQKQGVLLKVYKGIWAEVGNRDLAPYLVIPFLFKINRAYVSFITALHLHGIIEQIPQIITLASTAHTKIIRTELGTFSVHQLAPDFFDGFGWYKGSGSFLIAEPEKALVDCLYLSAHKKKQFGYFPELHFPKSFSFKRAKEWVKKIKNTRVRFYVDKKLESVFQSRIEFWR